MKNPTRAILKNLPLGLLLAFCALHSALTTCKAQGTAFTYQGMLNAGGIPASGSYDLQFQLYNAATSGTTVGLPVTKTATAVSNGLFTVTLDFGAGVFTGPSYWVQIAARTNGGATFTNLSPLLPITPTPYAIAAGSVLNLSGTFTNQIAFNNTNNTLNGTGTFTGSFTGNGAGLTNLNTANFVPTFGYFYLASPPDDAATIGAGTAVAFPATGPTNGISSVNSTNFMLPAIGVYEVTWQVSITEPGQLELSLNGTPQPQTVVGRATGTSQIMGDVLIQTAASNTVLEVINPAGNSPALTVTPDAGGTHAVTGSLVIKRIQ